MLTVILAAIAAGILLGIITGLTPGIHVNLVSLLILNLSPLLLNYTTPLALAVSIIAMAVTHTFLDAIPSIFLGAPDSATVLNVLPGHRMLLQGRGFEAVKLTVIGSLCALILAVLLMPFLIQTIAKLYPLIKHNIGYILIIVVSFMILKDKNRLWNLIVFLMSGTLGMAVLGISSLENPLFPMLSGLFGISMLVVSLRDRVKIPEQSLESEDVPRMTMAKAVTASTVAGAFTSMLPGLGPAQGAVLALQFVRKLGDYGFLILVGGINTVNFVLSLVTLFVLDRSRNGAVIAVSKIMEGLVVDDILVFTGAALVAGGVATFLALKISKVFARFIVKVNYRTLVVSIILLVSAMAFYFSSWLGLLVLFVSTMIGIIPNEMGIARNHAMGCLLLPVILYFIL